MVRVLLVLMVILVAAPSSVWAQAVQHGAQPNPQEVRPGSPAGDAPSAAAGEVEREPQPRVLGLPLYAAVTVAVALVALLAVAWRLRVTARRR